MAFKSSKGRDIGKEVATWQSNNIGQGIGGGAATAAGPGIVATGGTKTIDQGYAYHLFTSPGTFAVTAFNPNPFSAEFVNVLIVGGGGAGGINAVGVVTATSFAGGSANYTGIVTATEFDGQAELRSWLFG